MNDSRQWAEAMLTGDPHDIRRAVDDWLREMCDEADEIASRALADFVEAQRRHREARKEADECRELYEFLKETHHD